VDTPEQRNALPPEVAKKLETLNQLSTGQFPPETPPVASPTPAPAPAPTAPPAAPAPKPKSNPAHERT
jgi:hypothetical protein